MYYLDKAIILSRKDYREDDLLISVYTQKHGKIVLQAKGAKKIKSKLAGHIEPMNLVELNWVAGKGRDKLIGASGIESFKSIKENDRKVYYGFYFLDVVNKSIRLHHPDKRIFEFLKSVLYRLVETRDLASLQIIKLAFDYKLLYLLGYHPSNRGELGVGMQNLIKEIIRLPVDRIAELKLNMLELDSKAQEFLEEVIEEEIISLKSLK